VRQELRDRSNGIIGWLEQRSGRIEGRNRVGGIVGWYDIDRNWTLDRTGRVVGHGDLLSSLIATATAR
jgi:hypothetical protein